MSKNLQVTIQLTDELEQSLAELTTKSGQSISLIVQDALEHYVDWRAEQLLDLQEAIAAADRGEFATEDEVNAFFARYGA